jgi:Protein tyrosine and serine/threonine kinase
VVVEVAPSLAGRLTLVRSLSRSTWLAQLDGVPVVARAVTAPPAGTMQDPLLVPVIGDVDLDGTRWLVSEQVDGTSVQRLLTLTTLSASQAAYLAARTLAGLATLHAADRAHGRLHAGNVLVDRDGTIQLSDWALGTDATPADDLAAARELVAALVRNADRPAARRGELLPRLERLAAAPIADPAAAAGELEDALGDPATVADELGNLVGATNRPPGGVVAAAPLPPRLPHDRRPLTRGPVQRRWLVAAGTVLALAAAGAAVLAVSHRRHDTAQTPQASRTSPPQPASPSPARHSAGPVAATAVAPRSAGFVNGVVVTPVETCQPGASCSVRVTIKITAHDDVKHVAWTFVLVDPCTGTRTNVPGGSMIAQPSWQHIYTTMRVPLPQTRSVALLAMTTAPVRAASAPVTVPSGHAQC